MSRKKTRRSSKELRRESMRTMRPPGELVADPSLGRPTLRLFAYGPDDLIETPLKHPNDVLPYLGKWPVLWIDVDGLGDADVVRQFGEIFKLHSLALEDVLNVTQRPKVETYGDVVFFVARMLLFDEHVTTEQISLFLGRGFLLTFQEKRPGDCLGPVRERLRRGIGRLRNTGPDCLMHAILDAIIDGCFPMLEYYGEKLENLEDEILLHPSAHVVETMHGIKRDLLTLRRTMWPLRDAVNSLIRDPYPSITEETRTFFRDCYDHAIRIIDLIETDRELGSDLMDLYLTMINNRMNEVMKVLTIISTIFMPMTFVSGIYGMNFNTQASAWNMPELNWPFGYLLALSAMASIAGGFLFYFWRKGWIGKNFLPRNER